MKLTTEQWAELRAAAVADDVETFQRIVQEAARIVVACERNHARLCDRVRSFERGERPYLASER